MLTWDGWIPSNLDEGPALVHGIRLQSMAEICGLDKKPALPNDALGKVLGQITKGRQVFYDAPDGTRWKIKAKRVKRK